MNSRSAAALFDLTGRKAIITGGSRGLGLQIAEALGDMGAELVITARKANELEQAVDHLKARGTIAHGIASDQSKPEQIAAFVDSALAALGHVDILVNNAGATWGAPAEDHPLEGWLKLVNLNLTGVFLLTQAIGKRSMLPRGYGRILTVASIAGLRGNPPGVQQTLAYNTTKGGLVNFTRALAGEWGPRGITVNALAPGFFHSKMTAATLSAIEEKVIARAPLQRIGDDEDLKGAALLFCSAAGKHITGQILAIDGGVTAV
ncbi:MAG: SDR family oxidoreductase [Lautropia sp.]|nr:SDR family oxidoreductase [Lautropia sp.]